MRKVLFLDRDGTINVDYGYVFEREKFVFTDGVFDFCRKARDEGYEIVVITNQSGIARGYYGEEDFAALTEWMKAQFVKNGVEILDVLHCPLLEGPDRKPEPGLFLKAREMYDIDMAASISIGDKERDVVAGERASVGTNVLYRGSWTSLERELFNGRPNERT